MQDDNPIKEATYRVLKTVASPLHFFALAILCLTSIVIALSVRSILPADITQQIIFAAFILLIVLLLMVAVLVIFWPKKLIFDREAHLVTMREHLGDSELPAQYYSGSLPNVKAPKLLAHDGKKGEKR